MLVSAWWQIRKEKSLQSLYNANLFFSQKVICPWMDFVFCPLSKTLYGFTKLMLYLFKGRHSIFNLWPSQLWILQAAIKLSFIVTLAYGTMCTFLLCAVTDSPGLLPQQPQIWRVSSVEVSRRVHALGQVQINCWCALHNAAVLWVLFFSFLFLFVPGLKVFLSSYTLSLLSETPTQGRATMFTLASPLKPRGEPLKNNTSR